MKQNKIEKLKKVDIYEMGKATGTLGQAFLFMTIIAFAIAIAWSAIRQIEISHILLITLTPWSIIGIVVISKAKDLIDKKKQLDKKGD